MQAGDHAVRFYAEDEDRVTAVARYLSEGLGQGETVVVAAPGAPLAARLTELSSETAGGQLIVLDTAGLAERLASRNDSLPLIFDGELGTVIRRAAVAGQPVRAYGELGSLLPGPGALELEQQWNELARQVPFEMLCAYPWSAVDKPEGGGMLAALRGLHSGMTGGPPVLASAEAACRLPRAGQGPAQARRFVAATLGGWNLAGLADDAMLIITELALNAIEHARSGFTVSLARVAGTVRIAVGDASPVPPRRSAGPEPARAGGLDVVDAFAARWGHDVLPGGKLVWADLPAADLATGDAATREGGRR